MFLIAQAIVVMKELLQWMVTAILLLVPIHSQGVSETVHQSYFTLRQAKVQQSSLATTVRGDKVVVLMVDNRPIVQSTTSSKVEYQQVTAAINAKYAAMNGFEFRWYESPCPYLEQCLLDHSSRVRAAPWARIVAINETLNEFSRKGKSVTVLYLDSDAYISDHVTQFGRSTASIGIWEDEIKNQMCTGTMIVRNTPQAYEILDYWWHSDKLKEFDTSRQWEQSVLNKVVIKRYHDEIVKLPSLGWKEGEEKRYWDSGYFNDKLMRHRVRGSYSRSSLTGHNYVPFIKHMWGGLVKEYQNVVFDEMKRTNSSLLTLKNFRRCKGHPHMYCLQ